MADLQCPRASGWRAVTVLSLLLWACGKQPGNASPPKASGPADSRRSAEAARQLEEKARSLLNSGEFQAAADLLAEALPIREAVHGRTGLETAWTLQDLAMCRFGLAEYGQAKTLFEQAATIFRTRLGGSDVTEAQVLINLGACHLRLGDAASAETAFLGARRILEGLGPARTSYFDLGNVLSNLGEMYRTRQDFDHAEEAFGEAARLAGRLAVTVEIMQGTLANNRGSVAFERRDFARAARLHQRALECYRRANPDDAHPQVNVVRTNLAAAVTGLGEYQEAEDLLSLASANLDRRLGPDHPDSIEAQRHLMRLRADEGRLEEACARATEACRRGRNHLRRLMWDTLEDERLRYVGTWSRLLGRLVGLVPAVPDQGFRNATYHTVVAWKGQVYRSFRRSRESLFLRLDPAARKLLEELRQVSGQISTTASRGSVDRDALQQLKELERKLLDMQQVPWPEPPLALDDTLRQLPANAALVDFLIYQPYVPAEWRDGALVEAGRNGEEMLAAWVTRRDRTDPQFIDLGEAASLRGHAEALTECLVRGETLAPDLRETANRVLFERLWSKIAPHVHGKDVVILSPDGFLWSLPFWTLQDSKGRFLIEDHGFVFLQDWFDLQRLDSPAPPPSGRLLAMAGVDYDAPASAAGGPVARIRKSDALALRRWRELDKTEWELDSALKCRKASGALDPPSILRAEAATEGRLKQELPGHEVILLATHANFESAGRSFVRVGPAPAVVDLPSLQAYLVCAGANRPVVAGGDDGLLTAEEIEWLDLRTCRLAVLSACMTGQGQPAPGEGLHSLSRAFHLAGARTVISSLWNVHDDETRMLMESFYHHLWVDKMGTLAALRKAQLEQLQASRASAAGAPVNLRWGAFVLSGDWR